MVGQSELVVRLPARTSHVEVLPYVVIFRLDHMYWTTLYSGLALAEP